jgi:ABC-2 type transport system permease protein
MRRTVANMRRTVANIIWLGTKELRAFFHDVVLVVLVIWAFSLSIISVAQSSYGDLRNASIGIVDEDRSILSRRIADAFLPPYFKPPQQIAERDVDRLMNTGRLTFAVDVPPNFERDLRAGRQPTIQLAVDATAAMQAGIGVGYAQQIIMTEINGFLSRSEGEPASRVQLDLRIAFNPNLTTSWFTSVMSIIQHVTMLSIILAGAAIVREREHGTMDHLLVMPLTPFEIAMSKIWSSGLVITMAVGLSLYFVVRGILGVVIAGSVPLFLAGVVMYLFFATAVGIFLGTIARSMPQLGLLMIMIAMPMDMLSGAHTPLESMPAYRHAGLAVDPFRLVRPGDPVSRRGARHRVAAISGRVADRRFVPGPRRYPLPPHHGADDVKPTARGG